jgi:hypothetical protein
MARALGNELSLLIIPSRVIPLLEGGAVGHGYCTPVMRFTGVTSQEGDIWRFVRHHGPLLVVPAVPIVVLHLVAIVPRDTSYVEDFATIPAVIHSNHRGAQGWRDHSNRNRREKIRQRVPIC